MFGGYGCHPLTAVQNGERLFCAGSLGSKFMTFFEDYFSYYFCLAVHSLVLSISAWIFSMSVSIAAKSTRPLGVAAVQRLRLRRCAYSGLFACLTATFSFHPTLRKEALSLLRRLHRTAACHQQSSVAVQPEDATRRLSGGRLVEAAAAETELYFSNLAESWEANYKRTVVKSG